MYGDGDVGFDLAADTNADVGCDLAADACVDGGVGCDLVELTMHL